MLVVSIVRMTGLGIEMSRNVNECEAVYGNYLVPLDGFLLSGRTRWPCKDCAGLVCDQNIWLLVLTTD